MIARKFFDLQRFVDIKNETPNKTITGTSDSDSIVNSGSTVDISTAEGKDTIKNSGNTVTITAGAGNDYVENTGTDVTISGGSGDDEIYSRGNVSISGGDGSDYIRNWATGYGHRLTITGGKGNDRIDLESSYSQFNYIQYTYGDGEDTIWNFNSDDTLKLTYPNGITPSSLQSGGDLYIIFDGENSIVLKNVGTNVSNLNISLVNSEDSATPVSKKTLQVSGNANSLFNPNPYKKIQGTSGIDSVNNTGSIVDISTAEGKDTINNSGNTVTITAGAGNDSIYNTGTDVTISGGIGDDEIYSRGNVSISGGDGSDYIRNWATGYGHRLTITGGKGNDRIDLESSYSQFNYIQYTYGDGEDTIWNFNSDDTLELTTSKSYSTVQNGSDLTITFDEKNSIVLKNVGTNTSNLNIVTVQGGGSSGNGSGGGGGSSFGDEKDDSNGGNKIGSMTFTEALKVILGAVGTWGNAGSATTAKEAISYIETLTKDKKSNDNLLSNIFDLAKSDVGVFKGIYTVINNFVVKNSSTNQILQTSKTGKPFDENVFGAAAKKNLAFISLIANIFGLASSMSKAGYKLEEKTLHDALDDFADVAESIASSGASIANLKNAINAVEVSKVGPWSAVNIYLALATSAIGIVNQSAQSFSKYYYDDNKWDFNDTAEFLIDVSLSGLYGISHTLTLGLDDIIWNTLNGWKDTGGKSFPEIASENIKNFARNLGNKVNEFITNFKEGVGNVVENIADGLKLAGTILTVLTNNINSVWLGNSADFSDVKTVDGKSNNEDIILAGNSVSNSIVGGNGRNSLWGGASGNNTLTGGTARDQFWYGGNGKDIVTNFSAGNGANNDVVVLFGGELSGVDRSGSNVALNMSNGNSINLKTNSSSAEDVIQYSTDGNNIFGAKIGASNTKSLNYDSSVNYFQLNGGGTLNVSNSGENNVWLDGSQGQAFSGINNINATGNGKNILAGNGENNSIVSGSGNSSLWGGSGNSADTLVGGSGAEMFWYGKNDGADVINNASSGDIVNLYDVSLSDITSADISNKTISATFNTGNTLQINSSENLSATFRLADGNFKFNHSSGEWQSV